jgi:hypothetical protein
MEAIGQPGGIGEDSVGLGRTIEWHQHALKHLTPLRHTRPVRIEILLINDISMALQPCSSTLTHSSAGDN